MRKAVGYVRVSTIDQAEEGVSLDAQEQRIRAWCDLNEYELMDVKVDRGLSGGRADNRPALQEALQAVGRGDALVVYSLSRLARSTRDTLSIADGLDRRNADLVSLSERIETTSAAGKMLFRLLAVLAEFERDVVAERTSMAIRHMQSIGRFIGGEPPFGFRVVDGWVHIHEEEYKVVRLAHDLSRQGLSLRGVARALTVVGFSTRAGSPFHHNQVKRMINGRTHAVNITMKTG